MRLSFRHRIDNTDSSNPKRLSGMLELNEDELLVLFEWAHRFCETDRLSFSHYAEAVVIDRIAAMLERRLTEPFDPGYSAMLDNSRARILEDYESKMGKDTWIHKQPLEQT